MLSLLIPPALPGYDRAFRRHPTARALRQIRPSPQTGHAAGPEQDEPGRAGPSGLSGLSGLRALSQYVLLVEGRFAWVAVATWEDAPAAAEDAPAADAPADAPDAAGPGGGLPADVLAAAVGAVQQANAWGREPAAGRTRPGESGGTGGAGGVRKVVQVADVSHVSHVSRPFVVKLLSEEEAVGLLGAAEVRHMRREARG